MLCKRPTRKIEDTVKEMGGSEFFIEEKLDGERMQLHKRGNEFFYCSRLESPMCAYEILTRHFRKGKDYTYLYGKHVGTGSLTPFIDKAFDPRIDESVSIPCLRTNLSTPLIVSFLMAKCWCGIQYLNVTFPLER